MEIYITEVWAKPCFDYIDNTCQWDRFIVGFGLFIGLAEKYRMLPTLFFNSFYKIVGDVVPFWDRLWR